MRSVARQNWPLSFGVKPVKREAAALSILSAGPPDDVETMSLSFAHGLHHCVLIAVMVRLKGTGLGEPEIIRLGSGKRG